MEHFESKIVSVEVFDKSICHYVNYKKERRQLFGLVNSLPSGYYTDSDRFLGNEHDLLNGSYFVTDFISGERTEFILVCENKIAYWRPYVKINFESGSVKYKYLNTVGECDFYANNLRRNWSHLLLVDVNEL